MLNTLILEDTLNCETPEAMPAGDHVDALTCTPLRAIEDDSRSMILADTGTMNGAALSIF